MYREKIDAYIDAHVEEMIEDIFELCRINSERMPAEEDMPYGPGVVECLDAALDMAEGYGFDVVDYDGYVGCVDMNEEEKQLDILGHLDVVPAGEGWEITQPFEPILKDGKLYGRGTADDKGPTVAALYAMRAVKELGIPLTKNVRLIMGTDEECGSSDIAHYYKTEKEAPMTFSPDGAYPVVNVEKGRLPGHFVAEFTPSSALPRLVKIDAGTKVNVLPGKAKAVVEGFDLETLEAFAKEVELETGILFEFSEEDGVCNVVAMGKGGHAAHPQDGNNAITGLITWLAKLPFAECEQINLVKNLVILFPHGDILGTNLGVAMEDEVSGELTLVFSMLQMTDCTLDGQFDSRCPVCATEENALNVAKANLAAKGITLVSDKMRPPHCVDENSPFIQTLLKTYEEYTGLKGECLAIGGGTYVHDLKNGVAFGASMPGTDNRMHGADEFAVLEELVISAKMFANIIVELCS